MSSIFVNSVNTHVWTLKPGHKEQQELTSTPIKTTHDNISQYRNWFMSSLWSEDEFRKRKKKSERDGEGTTS